MKRYAKEIKLQAARLVLDEGCTVRDAAARIGASVWSVGNWVRSFRTSGGTPPASQPPTEVEDLAQLRKANLSLREEVELLKKAVAYFAKGSL